MPDYPLTSQRHPVNIERFIHRSALAHVGEGGAIEAGLWVDGVALLASITSPSRIRELSQDMERRRMITRDSKGNVTVQGLEGVILPPGWRESDAQRARDLARTATAVEPQAVPA
jgi:hypothetical protein